MIRLLKNAAVLWIRIRKNPKVSTRSESEKKFGFGYGFGPRHCNRMKIFVKIEDQTLKREKSYVFLLKTFFL
jgi:hypothetical protein